MSGLTTVGHRATLLLALLAALPAARAATAYVMDPARSTLTFVAKQYGAPVEGRFREFKADIVFAGEDLAGSRFEVTVATPSADTGEDDRDETLRGADFFAVGRFPSARFSSTGFRRTGPSSFEAAGRLTLRGVTREIRLPFTFEARPDGREAWLKGSVQINRLDYGVGQGEWKDTSIVGNEVTVKFALRLTAGS